MKRFSGNWQEGATKHLTFLSVVDSTRQGSKLRRVNIGSYASEADSPKDDPTPFIDALYSYLAAGMEPEAQSQRQRPSIRRPGCPSLHCWRRRPSPISRTTARLFGRSSG